MKKQVLLFVLLAFGIFVSGQNGYSIEAGVFDKTNMTKNIKDSFRGIALTEQQKTFVADNNAFTLHFLKAVNDGDNSGKSFVYSPLSITYVLSMVNAASEGATRMELQNTLGIGNGEIKDVNGFCKRLIDGLPRVDTSVQIHIANAIYVNKNSTLKKQFQQDMKSYYGAKAESLDFSSPKTLKHINDWCKKKTKGLIPEILSEVNPDAVSYLLNAIYFKAAWTCPFKKRNTQIKPFTTEKGQEKKLPMMQQTDEFRYMKNNIFAAVDLPYGDGKWRMTVILPEKGKSVSNAIDYLAKEGMSFLSQMRQRDVSLKLPRFETESTTEDLIGTMKKMGIIRAFDESQAEIRNMCNQDVYISRMLQKAHIKVDENGSKAAAVTSVEVFTLSINMDQPVVFHADHPFVYVIREASSGVILFVGKFTGQ
jgi:serpin B